MKTHRSRRPGVVALPLVIVVLLLLVNCAPSAEPEAAPAAATAQTGTELPASDSTPPVPATMTMLPAVSPVATFANTPATITLSQAAYDTTETVTYTVTNRLDASIYVADDDCVYGAVQRLEGDGVIPLRTHFFDPAGHFKHRIGPGEALACGWRQEVFQNPDAEGAARFLDVDPENGRRLPVPPGDYQVRLRTYLTEEEVGQESQGQIAVSQTFTIVPAPFREQLAVQPGKGTYRQGEPIGYRLRNVGEPREWRGPITLSGSGCGPAVIERLDGADEWVQVTAVGQEESGRSRLAPDGRLFCTVDPRLWPDEAPAALPLAPGTYRLGVTYTAEEALTGAGEGRRRVFSAPFSVTDEPAPAVTITVERDDYALGETVAFTISNETGTPIFATPPCGEPPVFWVQGNELRSLVMRITEEWIPAQLLPPGEPVACTWEQTAYNAGELPPNGFSVASRPLAVPPGTYQLRLHYFLANPDEDARPAGERDPGLVTVSRPFVIREP